MIKLFNILLIIFLFASCQNKLEQNSYHDFTYEFRDHLDESISYQENKKLWFNDGKKINLNNYHHLLSNTSFFNKLTLDSIITLGRFPEITKDSDFDLFLIQSDSNIIFLVGDKTNHKIISSFFPININMPLTIKQESYSTKIPLLVFTEIEEKIKEGYQKKSKHVYENIYSIDNMGKIIFRERVLDELQSFFKTPEDNPFSGKYIGASNEVKIYLTVKDGSSLNNMLLRVSFSHLNSGETITYTTQNLEIDSEKSVKYTYEDKLIYKITFGGESTEILWNGCLDFKDMPCNSITKVVKE